ncbi:AbrB/MazE/SpoVT family DNA-binding domain-containing protein [Xenorhabdus griffiniae]|uniref:AbrB/MazE/SpoVT family DNA-binding domain-containing protein n=1 Tax=Xenorhabdus griffiniae TaxID=351672 RepID=A0ABY9XP07_9GAMM|nr:AbrB/MazE/SpoVT family DNA-binding domain-containing protein [Xenorhabdus griffiniae]MBD1229048.1 AbrB/MazE/SpoVT family DNA-binding domain-containing protein [Xenorhabdus griffiniae]MBE8588796.1 AbrB/MazE/SpoVT family DNA-binding domain-containing protein [Xenorhabdus griffiniae]WMV74552.1 AbrB/MazE/SpoVT family DNA-binding domain-containing protein [Xenorhabdus griffiniae]WNH04231.1 AbrB/MazE/SpoVT family DNA-binding domain-containing protein [Xenorhabdus griffiniae]
MERIVKIFKNGRNQAIRLPVMFEFDTDRVYIRQDKNGDLILSKNKSKHDDWDLFFNMLTNLSVPDDFLDTSDRNQDITKRDPFEGTL